MARGLALQWMSVVESQWWLATTRLTTKCLVHLEKMSGCLRARHQMFGLVLKVQQNVHGEYSTNHTSFERIAQLVIGSKHQKPLV